MDQTRAGLSRTCWIFKDICVYTKKGFVKHNFSEYASDFLEILDSEAMKTVDGNRFIE